MALRRRRPHSMLLRRTRQQPWWQHCPLFFFHHPSIAGVNSSHFHRRPSWNRSTPLRCKRDFVVYEVVGREMNQEIWMTMILPGNVLQHLPFHSLPLHSLLPLPLPLPPPLFHSPPVLPPPPPPPPPPRRHPSLLTMRPNLPPP